VCACLHHYKTSGDGVGVDAWMPKWVCKSCWTANLFSRKICAYRRCKASNHMFVTKAPAWQVRFLQQCRGPLSLNDLGVCGDGIGGTLTPQSLTTCLGAIPARVKKETYFVDVGCGGGDVCVWALCDVWKGVSGIECRDLSHTWSLKFSTYLDVREAHASTGFCGGNKCFCALPGYRLAKFLPLSTFFPSWATPYVDIQWKTEAHAEDTNFLLHFPERLLVPVALFLFWKGWNPSHKQQILLKVLGEARVKYLMVIDSCRSHPGSFDHRDTLSIVSSNFRLAKYRCPVHAVGSGESYAFLLLERKVNL